MRPLESVDGNFSLPRARYLIVLVTLVVATLLPVLVLRALHLENLLDTSQLEVTDNETWLVTQLEVDLLKFRLALQNVRSEHSSSVSADEMTGRWPQVAERFDIFYSRVGAVASRVRPGALETAVGREDLRLLGELIAQRDQIADMLDEGLQPGGVLRLDELDRPLSQIANSVRDLSVVTLSMLQQQSAERRINYINEFRSLLILSVSIVLAMVFTCLAAWLLYRHIGVRAEAVRRLSENLYRVFDAKPDAILLTDANGRMTWMNVAAAALFGISEAEAKGHDRLDLFFPGVLRASRQGRTYPLAATDQEAAKPFRDIVRSYGGGTVPVEVTRIKLMAEGGDQATVLFVRDISETQRALRALRRERYLAEAEAERYQRFLAVMSHEIRSPLHAILASLDLARQRPGAAAMDDLHTIAMDAAQVALDEADSVLDIGRAEHQMGSAEPAVFSPKDVINDLVDMNRPRTETAGTKLVVEIGPGAGDFILGLRACFWHAVSNLVSNAVKFTKKGEIRVRLLRAGGDLRVEVVDNGPGIAPELQKLIFRDHFSHEPLPGKWNRGAGLGLGVFVSAVDAMSGQYGVESQLGQGSTFWFSFPALSAIAPKPVEAPKTSDAPAVPSRLRIMVVDDSHINRTLIQQLFVSLGLDIDLASSGADAVAMAHRSAYDLIFMDLSMPEMDGFSATEEIRKGGASSQATIFALTANVLARERTERPGSGFNGLMLKPLRLEELRSFLTTLVLSLPEPQEDGLPLIEATAAEDLLQMLAPTKIQPLLTTLFDSARALEDDLASGQPAIELQVAFHRVAGSAGMLAAEQLRALALRGEDTCMETGHSPLPEFWLEWRATIADTSQEWTKLLNRDDASTKISI